MTSREHHATGHCVTPPIRLPAIHRGDRLPRELTDRWFKEEDIVATQSKRKTIASNQVGIPVSLHRRLHDFVDDLTMRILEGAFQKAGDRTSARQRRRDVTEGDLMEVAPRLFAGAAEELEVQLRAPQTHHVRRNAS